MKTNADLAPLLESFFTKRLMAQRQVSPCTIAAYRDTLASALSSATHLASFGRRALHLLDR